MGNNIDYCVHVFSDYNNKFDEIIKKKLANKIYILDIETPTSSGIDAARKIRTNDFNSVIIFLTAHEELGYNLLKKELLFLTFINKFDDYENSVARAIKTALRKVNSVQMLRYNKRGLIYMIPLDDILYITRDSVERKSLIKTDYLEVLFPKNLSEIKEELPSNFVYSHRSCIVNKNRIRCVDLKKLIIKFNNQVEISLVSSLFKKEFEKE